MPTSLKCQQEYKASRATAPPPCLPTTNTYHKNWPQIASVNCVHHYQPHSGLQDDLFSAQGDQRSGPQPHIPMLVQGPSPQRGTLRHSFPLYQCPASTSQGKNRFVIQTCPTLRGWRRPKWHRETLSPDFLEKNCYYL